MWPLARSCGPLTKQVGAVLGQSSIDHRGDCFVSLMTARCCVGEFFLQNVLRGGVNQEEAKRATA